MHKHPHNLREAGNEAPSEYLDDPQSAGMTGLPPDPMGPVIGTITVLYAALVEILDELGPTDPIDAALAPSKSLVQNVLNTIAAEIATRKPGSYGAIPARIVLPASQPQYIVQAVTACNELIDYVNAFVVLPGVGDVNSEISLMTAVLGQLGIALVSWPQ